MDDIYHYTTEAVQANDSNSKQSEQDDVILNAFNSFGFGQRWNSLVDTVLQQSEQVVNVARNDLQEFAQVLRDDTTQTVEKISKSVKPDVKGKKRATNDDDEGIWGYIRQAQLPAALRLPDNIDLGKLREEMDQGTRFAEQYLQKFGAEVIQTVNKHIGLYDDDEEEPEGRPSTSSNPGKRSIFATRKERLLAEMRTDPETFTVKVPSDSVDVEKRTDEIAQTLDEFPDLREMMDRLVPVEVSYVLFWQRYFYHHQRIEHEDEKRQIIAKGAEDEDEFKWDSDDEDDEEVTSKNLSSKDKEALGKNESSKGKDKPSKDKEIVHKSEPVPSKDTAVPKTTDETPKAEVEDKSKKQEKPADDDSDSDWE
ncbi:hypothetical protein BJV82DRAFT_597077 [Fennellomyces sp. T-0311]|nr:hypothetical protein BJV82DRAFT_597077 [Fennellomyces sp. T-0311]